MMSLEGLAGAGRERFLRPKSKDVKALAVPGMNTGARDSAPFSIGHCQLTIHNYLLLALSISRAYSTCKQKSRCQWENETAVHDQ